MVDTCHRGEVTMDTLGSVCLRFFGENLSGDPGNASQNSSLILVALICIPLMI